MSRPAGEFTKAVRSLLSKSNGKMTHVEGRPELEKLGIEIVPEDTDRSSAEWKQEANAWNTAAYQWRQEHGLSSKGRKRGSGKKPKTATQSPKSKRRATKRSGTPKPKAPDVTLDEALEYLRQHNGAQAVRRRIEDIKKELSELESQKAELEHETVLHAKALEVVETAQEKIDKAA